jgi:phospholipid transport system substrate-binding protein
MGLLKRRSVIAIIGVTALVEQPGAVQPAWAQSGGQAVAFIKSTSDQLVAIVNSSDPPEQKRRQLQLVVDSTVDLDDLGRFCLGRFWRIATAEQQAQYMDLFKDLLVIKIAGHLGEYRGVRVTMGLARASADTEIVVTMVERPSTPPYQVDWVVGTSGGRPKIVDLLSGGTSLRLTQSADFTAYLARHQYNIQALLTAMHWQVAQNP